MVLDGLLGVFSMHKSGNNCAGQKKQVSFPSISAMHLLKWIPGDGNT